MGFLDVWKILEEEITEFRRSGITIPDEIIEEIRLSKAMIKVLEVNSDGKEICQKIESLLFDVRSFIISEGEKKFGETYVEDLLQRLEDVKKKPFKSKAEKKKRVFGMSKTQKWIRIKTSPELPLERLKVLASELGLSYDFQEKDYLLVYGKEENIKRFLEKMTNKYKSNQRPPQR